MRTGTSGVVKQGWVIRRGSQGSTRGSALLQALSRREEHGSVMPGENQVEESSTG